MVAKAVYIKAKHADKLAIFLWVFVAAWPQVDLTTCLPAATSPDTAPLEEVEDEDVDEVDELRGATRKSLDELDELDEELEELEDPDETNWCRQALYTQQPPGLQLLEEEFFSWCFLNLVWARRLGLTAATASATRIYR